MHHFFVTPQEVQENFITITGSDVKHIRNVLRMAQGEELSVSDGTGATYLCRICRIEEDCITADIIERQSSDSELPTRMYLFQGIPKGDKMELIIQKAVELGVYEIIPVQTRRCVVKLDQKKEAAKQKRWTAISESAAKQSGRDIIPKVHNVISFPEAIEYAKALDQKLMAYEKYTDMQRTKTAFDRALKARSVGILVGPEGGFEEEEASAAAQAGWEIVSLGRRILRTETAGFAILSVLMFGIEEGNIS